MIKTFSAPVPLSRFSSKGPGAGNKLTVTHPESTTPNVAREKAPPADLFGKAVHDRLEAPVWDLS
jgi:hypothetical protein